MHPRASARLGPPKRARGGQVDMGSSQGDEAWSAQGPRHDRSVERGRQTYLAHNVRLYCHLARSFCAPRDGLKSTGQIRTANIAARLMRPLPATLILVLLWTAWRIAFLLHTGIPEPSKHDEFSYLLGADIFAHGHLASPPHVLGRFFESPHILVQPTYASKYPPGQALFLALGQVLFGSPFFGVLIGNALMLFTFGLMLFAWVPFRWALAVSAMFALCLSPAMYWTNSYWGGSVAASGGALVLLGIGVYRTKQTPLAGAIFAVGALLLFWTRPFEGGLFTVAVLIVFGKELWRSLRTSVVVVAVSMLAIGGAWTCYDNQAVTGNPFRLPYLLHARQYSMTPVFWFLPLQPEPTYSSPRLASQYGTGGWEEQLYEGQGTWWQPMEASTLAELRTATSSSPRLASQYATGGSDEKRYDGQGAWWRSLGAGVITTLRTLEWPLRSVLLLMLLVPVAWRDPLYRKMSLVAGVCLLGLSVETFHQEHYTAPAWAAVALMIAIWAKHAWGLQIRERRVGVVPVLVALALPAFAALPSHAVILPQSSQAFSEDTGNVSPPGNWADRRAALVERLSALDRRQLVIVRYPSPDWHLIEEWVYNGADIDHQRVVFAHDLGIPENRALLHYYPDRTAMLLTFDNVSRQEQIVPYPLTPSQQ